MLFVSETFLLHLPLRSQLCSPVLDFRYVYIDWLHYSWGALMINAFEGKNVQISGYEVRVCKAAGLRP